VVQTSKNRQPATTPFLSQKGVFTEEQKVLDKSTAYEFCRYWIPSTLPASQAEKAVARARKKPKMRLELLTYDSLLCEQSRSIDAGHINKSSAANRATALRLFVRANHLQLTDPVGAEMRGAYSESVDTLVQHLRAQGRTDRSISNTRAILTPWKHAVIAWDQLFAETRGELSPFQKELQRLVQGFAVKRIARQAYVPSGMIFGWLNGKSPRASNARYLRKLEGFFGLEHNHLVNLACIGGRPQAATTIGRPDKIKYRVELSKRTQLHYYLKPGKDSPLRHQWQELLKYKTAPVPMLERSNSGRWTFSSLKVIQCNEKNWASFLDEQEVPSARPSWNKAASYLGWLALSVEQGGKGFAEDALQTLAWIAVPGYAEDYLEWHRKNAGGVLSRSALEFLALVQWMTRPVDGYLYQQPHFRDTLPPEHHLVDWTHLCERQFKFTGKLKNAMAMEVKPSRNPFEPIRHILELEQPLEAVADMLHRMRVDKPTGTIRDEAVWSRDLVLIKLLATMPLRLRNMATLTWNADNSGSVYQRADDSWWVRIERSAFKNRRGAVCARDFDTPMHSAVWRDLERYLHHYRPHLLRWPSDLLFLVKTRDPAREESVKGKEYRKAPLTGHTPSLELSRHVKMLTQRYLWRCPGVGMHAFRHIVATAILKAPQGDIKTAALVLNDSQSTVEKSYAFLRSGDGALRMAQILESTLKRL
jgi:hypothetical protein